MKGRQPYEILDISIDSSPAKVRSAYIQKSHQFGHLGDSEGLERVNLAYHALGDPEQKLIYDLANDLWRERDDSEEVGRSLAEAKLSLLSFSQGIVEGQEVGSAS